MERIGLFGGSFDPVHAGHLAVARSAVRELRLSKLYFVPAKLSPFKTQRPAPPRHRLAMLRLVLPKVPKSGICAYELRAPGPSYTVRTVRHFRKRRSGARFFWVMGGDALKTFRRWKDWVEILRACDLAVAPRQGESRRLPGFLKPFAQKIFILGSIPPGVSSSSVRSGKAPAGAVTSEVRRYIERHGLYPV